MQAADLTDGERQVLYALLSHLAEADARIDPDEMLEIDMLAEELGLEGIQEKMLRARAVVQTHADLVAALARVVRPDARELIRTVLFDLAQSDGEVSAPESALLALVKAAWA